jgi:hypothetical protein
MIFYGHLGRKGNPLTFTFAEGYDDREYIPPLHATIKKERRKSALSFFGYQAVWDIQNVFFDHGFLQKHRNRG